MQMVVPVLALVPGRHLNTLDLLCTRIREAKITNKNSIKYYYYMR